MPAEAVLTVRDAQLFEEPWRSGIQHGEAAARSAVTERTGEPCFADTRSTVDEHVVRAAQLVAAGQLGDQDSIQSAARAPVDVFDAGSRDLQFGRLQQPLDTFAVAPVDLALHEQCQALLEGQ